MLWWILLAAIVGLLVWLLHAARPDPETRGRYGDERDRTPPDRIYHYP